MWDELKSLGAENLWKIPNKSDEVGYEVSSGGDPQGSPHKFIKLAGGYRGLLAAIHGPYFKIKYSEAAEMFRIIF